MPGGQQAYEALARIPDLESAAWQLIQQIPRGRITTYGTLARALGDVRASRWVGTLALKHRHDEDCNCHRIVRANGELGGFVTGDVQEKREQLAIEDSLDERGLGDLERKLYSDFQTTQPLAALRKYQHQLANAAVLEPISIDATEIGAVDVSYRQRIAFASLVVLVQGEDVPAWQYTVRQPTDFPYISSYLAFRELPIYLHLIAEAAKHGPIPEVLLVDGSGVLHPRHSGIATMLGVTSGYRTVGITKKRLCGRFCAKDLEAHGTASVYDGETQLGVATLGSSASQKPLFISPGHRVDVPSALAVTRRFWGPRRVPAPIYWADRLSREAATARRPTAIDTTAE